MSLARIRAGKGVGKDEGAWILLANCLSKLCPILGPHRGGIENGILNLFLLAAKFHLLLPRVKSLSLSLKYYMLSCDV